MARQTFFGRADPLPSLHPANRRGAREVLMCLKEDRLYLCPYFRSLHARTSAFVPGKYWRGIYLTKEVVVHVLGMLRICMERLNACVCLRGWAAADQRSEVQCAGQAPAGATFRRMQQQKTMWTLSDGCRLDVTYGRLAVSWGQLAVSWAH